MRLLFVEDNKALATLLLPLLSREGYAVDWIKDGQEALWQGEHEPYDVVILDLGLPHLSGIDILQNWRKKDIEVPVLILTARDSWAEKIAGLRAGADDYLTKPFHQEELLLRLQAMLRRVHGRANQQCLQTAGITLDEMTHEIVFDQKERTALTAAEFRLLRYFMLHPHRLLSKSRLSEHVYEGESDLNSNVLEVLVKRLRNKLGQNVIKTQRGQGYIFQGTQTDV